MRPIILLLILVLPCIAQAQDNKANSLDTVEVTGSRISRVQLESMPSVPAITIARKGDYLLQQITLINDTRSAEGRKQEIHATLVKMIEQAGGRYELLYGGENRVVLNRDSPIMELEADDNRADVSRVTLYVKAPAPADAANGDDAIQTLRKFVANATKVGRTEIDMPVDTAIGMNNPEKYRHEVIAAIAEDSGKVGGELGSGCKVELSGLNSRIQWQRVSAVELLLYIPYSMKVSECGVGKG